MQGQVLEVDDVHVGLLADGEFSAVGQAEQVRRVSGLFAYDPFERQPGTSLAVACPVREEVGGDRGVADHAAVGAAVGEARHRRRVEELFPDGLVVAVGVVEQRQHEQCLAVLFAECVVDGFERVGVGALGQVGHRTFGFGFVVGWVAEDVELVERHAEQGRHSREQFAVGFDVVFGEDS